MIIIYFTKKAVYATHTKNVSVCKAQKLIPKSIYRKCFKTVPVSKSNYRLFFVRLISFFLNFVRLSSNCLYIFLFFFLFYFFLYLLRCRSWLVFGIICWNNWILSYSLTFFWNQNVNSDKQNLFLYSLQYF